MMPFVHLFIGTLKRVTFEWFMKLLVGSIKTWTDLEKVFIVHLFEDDIEISVPTLLAAKQKKEESLSRLLSKDFGAWHSVVPVA